MDKLLDVSGNVVGIAGILICLLAGISRLIGEYYILKFEIVTLVIGGTALMVMACLIKLHNLSIVLKARS